MKECTNDQNKQKNKTRKYKENEKNNNNTTIVPEGVIPKYLQTIYKQYTGIHIYIYIYKHESALLVIERKYIQLRI